MPQIDPHTVLWKEMDGKVVVLHIETGSFFELNAVGSEIWRGLAKGSNTEQIMQDLRQIYDVPDKALSADIDSFMQRMTKQGLLKK